MHEDQEVFTVTLIVEGNNSKLLLSTSETPAKDDTEASGVIYKEDLPEQFNQVVSKIPIFKTAIDEDGSEESITHTLEEFSNIYDLDLLDIIESGDAELRPILSEEVDTDLDYNPFERITKHIDFSYIDPREALD